jgi:hypothetical protein
MGGPHARERHVNSGEPPTKVASTEVIGVAMRPLGVLFGTAVVVIPE